MAGRGAGMSRYNGLRLTLTFSPRSPDVAFVGAAFKTARGGWDEWTMMVPTIRIDGMPAWDLQEAMDAMLSALDDCEDLAWSSQG